jgi:cobalamin biosynthesis protein CobD/CbiB
MIGPILPLLIGFGIDCVLGDPHSLPHPVVLIGKTISALECVLRRIFAKTPRGERAAGAVGDRLVSCDGGTRAASVFVRQGESVAAPRGRERHVLADLGGKVAAG